MLMIFAVLAGLLAALLIHSVTWVLRLHRLSWTAAAGALSLAGLTWFFFLFRDSDIAREVFTAMLVLYAIAVGIGIMQAISLGVPWWKGVLGVFFEMALTFLVGAAVNLTLQRYIPWLEAQFPGIDVYAIINSFLWAMIITLLLLAVVRPLLKKHLTGLGDLSDVV